MKRPLLTVSAILIGSVLAGRALAQDVTRHEAGPRNWTHAKGGPARITEWTDPKVKPPFELKWVFWGEDQGSKGSPLAVDGVILFPNVGRFGGGNIFGIDARTGKELWRRRVGKPYVVSMASSDGLVFYPDKAKGLLAFDVKTGRRAWSRGELGKDSAPLAAEGMVFTTSRKAPDVLYAVNTKTGRDVWHRKIGIGRLGGLSYSSGLVVVSGSDGTVALSAGKGQEKWRAKPKGVLHPLYPTMIADGVVYVPARTGKRGYCAALSLADGQTIWEKDGKARCVGDGKVFGITFARDAKTGKPLWNYAKIETGTTADICCSPIYHNGVMYWASGGGGSLPWQSTCFATDAKTGKVLWRYKTCGAGCPTPLIYDGRAYFAMADCGLYCFEPVKEKAIAVTRPAHKDSRAGFPAPGRPAAVTSGWTALHGSDPANTGVAVARDVKVQVPLKPLWTFQTGGRVRSSAAIVGGTAYIGSSDGKVYAINVKDGAKKWEYPTEAEVYSSPAVASGMVYVGSRDGNIYALDAQTGEKKWHRNVGRPVRASGVVVGGVLYIGSGEVGFENGKDEQERPNFWALEAKSGKIVWNYNCGGVWARPAISDGTVYIMSINAYLSAVDMKTGKQLWNVNTWVAPVWSSPVIYRNTLFFGSTNKSCNYVYAMDPKTGWPKWIAHVGTSDVTMCAGEETLYCYDYWNGLRAIDLTEIPDEVRKTSVRPPIPRPKKDWIAVTRPLILAYGYNRRQTHRVLGRLGKRGGAGLELITKWRYPGGKMRSGIVMTGGYVWAVGQRQGKARISAVDPKSGKAAWRQALDRECWSTPAIVNGLLVVGCDDGKVYAFGGN